MCLRKLLQTVLKEIFVFNIKVIVVNQNLESFFDPLKTLLWLWWTKT